jgi:hypothetical protein
MQYVRRELNHPHTLQLNSVNDGCSSGGGTGREEGGCRLIHSEL